MVGRYNNLSEKDRLTSALYSVLHRVAVARSNADLEYEFEIAGFEVNFESRLRVFLDGELVLYDMCWRSSRAKLRTLLRCAKEELRYLHFIEDCDQHRAPPSELDWAERW